VIGVEETKHFRVGLFSAAVLENADVSVLGNGLLDALRELNRAMMGIVMTYKTTHETDDNVDGERWHRSGLLQYRRLEPEGGQQRPGLLSCDGTRSAEERRKRTPSCIR